ncbi:MAG: DUF4145 domain-containing protein [Alphaproteobacteria bacterium]|nr:DUF4145 domain-containing protein [Alphaproteobacteria bacterium]
MSDPETVKSHCNACGRETKHHVRFTHAVSDSEYIDLGIGISWESRYAVLECCGCEDISLRKISWFSEAPGENEVTFYPPRISRRKPVFHDQIPQEFTALLDEIYSALHADNRRLAMMGARAVLDMFIMNKVGDQGSFKNGMQGLQEAGFVTSTNRSLIEAAIDAGHAAAHRGHLPSVKEVSLVMDIIENLIQHDLLSEAEMSLRDSTPKKPARTSS